MSYNFKIHFTSAFSGTLFKLAISLKLIPFVIPISAFLCCRKVVSAYNLALLTKLESVRKKNWQICSFDYYLIRLSTLFFHVGCMDKCKYMLSKDHIFNYKHFFFLMAYKNFHFYDQNKQNKSNLVHFPLFSLSFFF